MFSNGPEYEWRRASTLINPPSHILIKSFYRLKNPFSPPTVSLKEIHDAVPKHLLHRSPSRSLSYVIRDLTMAVALVKAATYIGPLAESNFGGLLNAGWQTSLAKTALWMTYWWFMGLVGAGIFCLGHDAGHGSLFPSTKVNNTVGFFLHSVGSTPRLSFPSLTNMNLVPLDPILCLAFDSPRSPCTSQPLFLLGSGLIFTRRKLLALWRYDRAPFLIIYANVSDWRQRDENYVPYTRSEYNLPPASKAKRTDYAEAFEETPIYTLVRVMIMQGMGWWLYLRYGSVIFCPLIY